MALKPIGTCITQVTANSAAKTGPIAHKSDTLRLCAITKEAHVKVSFGADPTATASDFYIPVNTTASLSIGGPQANRVVGITTGATTIIDFPEGTGSPFGVGDAVTLSVPGQDYYDFEHKLVTNVDSSAGNGGYFSTRITVNSDTSGVATALSSQNAELRGSFKVSALADGAGKLYIQQVQITGEG